ncbi:MAG: hypothetical protein KZQ88_01600 [Candidatus Thiodiazotropha sp. (ex Dulcina madagascariensis)]|nr:hypothetical protein [Candidatus Thiodiazotropha sp. (ex Dulcina madagascariensis)]MCU7926205.1 hypothetical protein [Candidatus Thiodiazotropha sp. (ex Dulcina madagascariensis)]
MSTMPARPSVAKAAHHAPLNRLATIGCEKCGLKKILFLPQFHHSETIDDIEYDLDLQWRSIALFADWHPFGSRFRFTAGLLRNNNEFTGSTAATTLTIGDTTYSDTGLDARLEFNKHAPYLGLGWGNLLTTGSGWGFNVDLGIMYQGSASVSLTPTGAAAVLVDPDDLDKEEQSFEDDIKLYRYYPVFSFGVSYRF